MINTDPIEYPGIDAVMANAEFYKEKFFNDSLLVFRNANMTHEEQEVFTRSLGDHIGWFPNTSVGVIERYTENHAPNALLNEHNKDVVVLPWHVEHVYFGMPIAASTWNMYKFNIDPDHGKTYFVDTNVVYEMLPDDWKDFLQKSTAYAYDYNYKKMMRECKVILNHWYTNKPIIRFQLDKYNDIDHLKTYDGRTPTQAEKEKFLEIARFVYDQIANNEDIRIVHRWKAGDLVIPDMFKLAHAITGGFSPKDREFTGLWLYATDNTNNPR